MFSKLKQNRRNQIRWRRSQKTHGGASDLGAHLTSSALFTQTRVEDLFLGDWLPWKWSNWGKFNMDHKWKQGKKKSNEWQKCGGGGGVRFFSIRRFGSSLFKLLSFSWLAADFKRKGLWKQIFCRCLSKQKPKKGHLIQSDQFLIYSQRVPVVF